MEMTRPQGFDGERAKSLLARARDYRPVAERVEVFSELLLGYPYQSNSLLGSLETPEVFTSSFEAFDCVTYVETVLALALSPGPDDFANWLRRIRYEEGRVEWARRNHYMTSWMRNNVRLGAVWPVAAEALATRKERILDAVPGLPPKKTRFWCIPKSRIRRFGARLRTGDLIFFVSTRKDLDVFHCGVLVKEDDRLRMRHAARSRQSVVEQDLAEFLKENSMSGLMAVRPVGEIGGGNP
jgi:hypothetical protein